MTFNHETVKFKQNGFVFHMWAYLSPFPSFSPHAVLFSPCSSKHAQTCRAVKNTARERKLCGERKDLHEFSLTQICRERQTWSDFFKWKVDWTKKRTETRVFVWSCLFVSQRTGMLAKMELGHLWQKSWASISLFILNSWYAEYKRCPSSVLYQYTITLIVFIHSTDVVLKQ